MLWPSRRSRPTPARPASRTSPRRNWPPSGHSRPLLGRTTAGQLPHSTTSPICRRNWGRSRSRATRLSARRSDGSCKVGVRHLQRRAFRRARRRGRKPPTGGRRHRPGRPVHLESLCPRSRETLLPVVDRTVERGLRHLHPPYRRRRSPPQSNHRKPAIDQVLADKPYDAEHNQELARRQMRRHLLTQKYRQRWQFESVFSRHKRRLREALLSRSSGDREHECSLRHYLTTG